MIQPIHSGAVSAAGAVGPAGQVLGVDLAHDLLALARDKAQQRGLGQLEFRTGDLLNLDSPPGAFDAVVCVFGIFFVPDLEAAARALWLQVRPGGRLAVTTWGPRFLEPMNTVFWNSVREVRPELYKSFNPWDRISDPEALRSVLAAAEVEAPEIVPEAGAHALPEPEDWWSAVLGTGYRGTVEQLDADSRERVRRDNLDVMRRSGITQVEVNVIYALATKAGAEEVASSISPF